MRGVAKGSHQILDLAFDSSGVIPGSGTGTAVARGTIWPLLPNLAYRIFNVSAQFIPGVDSKVKANTLKIYLQLLDGGNNVLAEFDIAAENYTDPCFLVSGGVNAGAALAHNGDPIIEFFSNLNLSGKLIDAGGNPVSGIPASFQMSYRGQFTNTDAAAHAVTVSAAALFSSVPL